MQVSATAEGPLYYLGAAPKILSMAKIGFENQLGDILYRQHRHAECQFYLSRQVYSGVDGDTVRLCCQVRLVDTNCTTDYKTGALCLTPFKSEVYAELRHAKTITASVKFAVGTFWRSRMCHLMSTRRLDPAFIFLTAARFLPQSSPHNALAVVVP